MSHRSSESIEAASFLGKHVFAKMDRPLGSKHPEWGFVYRLNYGFIPGVFSPDGEELDAYVLGIAEPIENFTGLCIAVIHRLNDLDDKVVLAAKNTDFSDEEIIALTDFQERFFSSVIIRPKRSSQL